jgi:hypothetical protein
MAATKPRQKKSEPSPEARPKQALVAEVAYFIAESRGFVPGHELDDWVKAESTLDSETGQRG